MAAELITGICIVLPLALIFAFFSTRPLSQEGVDRVSMSRRNKAVKIYYALSTVRLTMSAEGKKRWSVDGNLIPANEPLETFPATIAALLKYKKHEWIVFGFEKERRVVSFWINKGNSNSQVAPKITHEAIKNIAASLSCSSVIRLHNHPNGDPQHYNMLVASEQDYVSGRDLSEKLSPSGINYFDFVCERGSFLEYYSSVAPQFLPVETFAGEVIAQNGKNKWSNLLLHLENFRAA